jgi:hypothetical protein
VTSTPRSDGRSRLWRWVHGTFYAPMTVGARRAFVTLLVIVFLLAGMNLVFTARQVNAVRAAAASVVQLCQLGNETRGQQVSLWEHLVTISRPPPHESAAERRRRLADTRAFLAYVEKVFAKRDCTAQFGG